MSSSQVAKGLAGSTSTQHAHLQHPKRNKEIPRRAGVCIMIMLSSKQHKRLPSTPPLAAATTLAGSCSLSIKACLAVKAAPAANDPTTCTAKITAMNAPSRVAMLLLSRQQRLSSSRQQLAVEACVEVQSTHHDCFRSSCCMAHAGSKHVFNNAAEKHCQSRTVSAALASHPSVQQHL